MSNARKLQTEIDRVMKKVDEGAELFDEIWLKVKSADSQNLKEKHEVDLKKEIKKLQRLRDQIKTWVGSSDVKDKDSLIDARKLIETKMETFKICEKETKTKTYSKEGLAREDKLDPAEEAKNETTAWLQEYLDKLQGQVEEKDFEIEKLSSGKGKKTNKHHIEDKQEHIINHRFHINKLEAIIRLVNNDAVEVDTVDAIKEDLDYYLDSHEEEDYRAGYDEEFFYETLGLEDILDVAVMGSSTTGSTKKTEDSVSVTSSKGSSNVKAGKKAASVIPMTIGRARSSTAKKDQGFGLEEKEIPATTPKKATPPSHPKPAPGSAPRASSTVAAPGASMASILSRQTELQEKERQKEQLRQDQLRQEQLRQQQQLKQQQQEQLRQQEARRVQQAEEEAAAREREVKESQQRAAAALLAAEQQKNAVLQAAAAQQQAVTQQQQQQQPTATMTATSTTVAPTGPKNALDMLSSGLSGLTGLGGVATTTTTNAPSEARNTTTTDSASVLGSLTQSSTSTLKTATSGSDTSAASYLTALNESYVSAPGSGDAERNRPYTPQNPYPTLASYPTHPSPIFDSPVVFEKLGTDCLFFIFYYAQGTYQQYLAARELKKQSWRFHKKYQAWFQRHEEPKITTDDYEQGTYVYFDYETGWCTRIKQDFRFEYSYLEDSLQ